MEHTVEVGNAKRFINVDAGSSNGNGGAKSGTTTTSTATTTTAPSGETKINAVVDQVAVTKTWKAHSDSINSLQIIEFPPSILSAGNDRMAKIWEMDGATKGILRQGGTANRVWNFDYDKKGTRDEKLRLGGEIMEEVLEMGKLVLESGSEEEEEEEEGGIMWGLREDEDEGEGGVEESKAVFRKTPKRVPVDARTVGRKMRRK